MGTFFKGLRTASLIMEWLTRAMAPDADGKSRISLDEMKELVEGVLTIWEIDVEIDVTEVANSSEKAMPVKVG